MTTPELIDWGTPETTKFLLPYVAQSFELEIHPTYETMVHTHLSSSADSSKSSALASAPSNDFLAQNYTRAIESKEMLLPSLYINTVDLFRFVYIARASHEDGKVLPNSKFMIGHVKQMGTIYEKAKSLSPFSEKQIRFLANMALEMQNHGLSLRS